MSAIGSGTSGPGIGVDLWLAARKRRMVLDLAATLDLEAGLREARWVRDDRAPSRADSILGRFGDG